MNETEKSNKQLKDELKEQEKEDREVQASTNKYHMNASYRHKHQKVLTHKQMFDLMFNKVIKQDKHINNGIESGDLNLSDDVDAESIGLLHNLITNMNVVKTHHSRYWLYGQINKYDFVFEPITPTEARNWKHTTK